MELPSLGGQLYVTQAAELLKAFDRLESDTTAQSTAMSGPLRVGASSELGRKIIAPTLARSVLFTHGWTANSSFWIRMSSLRNTSSM